MNYSVVLLEIFTALIGIIILALGLILPKEKKGLIGYISAFLLLCLLVFSLVYTPKVNTTFYNGSYESNNMSIYFKQIFIISAILVTLMAVSFVKKHMESRSEFFALIIFALLGMMIMVSSNDLITLYIGIEIMSLSFIILTAIDKANIKSTVAGTKYILLSGINSAVLLYGMSFLYGVSGSVNFTDILNSIKTGNNQSLVILGSILFIAGIGFKVSAVPFHMWSPDVYEGAPTPITAFLVAGSKVAAFSVFIKLCVEIIEPSFATLSSLIIVLAVLSMVVGNLLALPQKNIKRMLAYSGVAHAGYIMLGIVSHTSAGISAMMYYLLLYIFANIGAFAAITAFSNQDGKEEIQDFRGMWKRSPLLSVTLIMSLLSMAGIPPAAGFIGKLYLFSEVAKQGYLWLVFIAMAMSVVSVYYYINVIKVMLLGKGDEAEPIKIGGTLKLVMVVCTIMILVMGLYPGPITNWTTAAAAAFIR